MHQSAVKCLFILSIATPLGNQASLLHPTQLIQSTKKGSLTQKHQGFLMWMYGYPETQKVSKTIGGTGCLKSYCIFREGSTCQ